MKIIVTYLSYFLLVFVTFKNDKCHAQPDKLWATYFGLGAPLGMDVTAIAYDSLGFIYISGHVAGDEPGNIATPGSFKPQPAYDGDGYLAKFDSLGNRIWATYFGNNFITFPKAITIDKSGSVIVASIGYGNVNLVGTAGTYHPQMPPVAGIFGGPYGFVIKFNANGNRLWGTYLNSAEDSLFSFCPQSVACDEQGNILLGGTMQNIYEDPSDTYTFPSTTAFQPSSGTNGYINAFIMKLSSSGNFGWGSFYGNGNAQVSSIACNTENEIYISVSHIMRQILRQPIRLILHLVL